MLYYLAGIRTTWAKAADLSLLALFLLLVASHSNVEGINQMLAGATGFAPIAIPNLLFNLFAVCLLSSLLVTVWLSVGDDRKSNKSSTEVEISYSSSEEGDSAHGGAGDGGGGAGDGGGGDGGGGGGGE